MFPTSAGFGYERVGMNYPAVQQNQFSGVYGNRGVKSPYGQINIAAAPIRQVRYSSPIGALITNAPDMLRDMQVGARKAISNIGGFVRDNPAVVAAGAAGMMGMMGICPYGSGVGAGMAGIAMAQQFVQGQPQAARA